MQGLAQIMAGCRQKARFVPIGLFGLLAGEAQRFRLGAQLADQLKILETQLNAAHRIALGLQRKKQHAEDKDTHDQAGDQQDSLSREQRSQRKG